MKGFLLGVLLTLIVRGTGYYLQVNYGTLQTCQAIEDTLSESVIAALEADIQRRTGSNVAGQIARGVLQPAAEPIVRQEVQKDIRDHNWWQCTLDLIHIDFLGGRADRVAMIKDRLSLP